MSTVGDTAAPTAPALTAATAHPDEEAGLLARGLRLHPQVALRPEPFGALAYHYGTRRLVFLRHPDLVDVVRTIHQHPTVADALAACDLAPARHRAFTRAIAALLRSDMLQPRDDTGPSTVPPNDHPNEPTERR